ncbi:hypothetical protein B296_00006449 [Ensete ventricosum]|uniref:Uncharacterized protein n=1 Tax=Ensete ventricosum TaxID=4639 RepID=A0A427AJ65_ENSVE|nr:hypothetical protein B296_00006449 [Ensete ventricosum]
MPRTWLRGAHRIRPVSNKHVIGEYSFSRSAFFYSCNHYSRVHPGGDQNPKAASLPPTNETMVFSGAAKPAADSLLPWLAACLSSHLLLVLSPARH